MSPLTALRSSSAIWLVPLLFAAGVFVGFSNATPDETYDVAVFASASRSVILLGPLLTAAVAFKAGALATYLRDQRAIRRPFAAYWGALWPLLVLGPAAAFLAAAWVAKSLPTSRYTLAISGVLVLTAFSCAMLGLAIGLVLPRLFAAPLGAIATYLWLAYPATGGDALLRNINGSFVGCCTIDQYPATSMLYGSTALLLVVIVGVLAAVNAGRSRLFAGGLLVSTLLAAWGAAAASTTAVDATPSLMAVQARTGNTICTASAGVELCVWPEHRSALPETNATVANVVHKLESAGLGPVPVRYAESPRAGFAPIQVANEARDSDIAFTLVSNMLPQRQFCRPAPGVNVYAEYDHSLQWLAVKAGLTADEVSSRLGSSIAGSVREILSESQEKQRQWFESTKALLSRQCRT